MEGEQSERFTSPQRSSGKREWDRILLEVADFVGAVSATLLMTGGEKSNCSPLRAF
jgi:hypothetical protein